jgi:sigma-E factor negative regulatory protein RseA
MPRDHDPKENLSALMDGEAGEFEQAQICAALARDPQLSGAWERYHLIRAVLSRGLAPILVGGVAQRVAAQIGQLPSPGVPAWRDRLYPVRRWAGQLALAASIAAVAILGARWILPQGVAPDATPLVAGVEPQVEIVRAGVARWEPVEPEIAHLLNTYLVEHNEISPAASMKGVMPYGRFVGYDNSP